MRENEKEKVHNTLKQEIRSLLISSPKSKYGGLTGSLLYFDYKQLNSGKEVPYVELGFHSFLALLRSMPDVVQIEYKENSFSYRVHPVYDQSTQHIRKMVLQQRDKYEHQNRSYNENWHSDNSIPNQFYNYDRLPYTENSLPYYPYNSVETNFPVDQNSFHHRFKNSLRRTDPMQLSVPNRGKLACALEPYLLLTPVTPTDHEKADERRNFHNKNRLTRLSSKSNNNNNETCSTPNTFLETPPHFDFDDYRLKDIQKENELNSPVNDQTKDIPNDSLLLTPTDLIFNKLPNSKTNQPSSSSPIFVANRNISPAIIDGKSSLNNDSETNENAKLIKRLNNAIRQCIDFRYIHRLYQLKFEYRHHLLSDEVVLIKSHYEKLAFIQYQQDLEDFERESQLNSTIDDQKCRTMFDQYISLQRNYYYMKKIMKKKQRIN